MMIYLATCVSMEVWLRFDGRLGDPPCTSFWNTRLSRRHKKDNKNNKKNQQSITIALFHHKPIKWSDQYHWSANLERSVSLRALHLLQCLQQKIVLPGAADLKNRIINHSMCKCEMKYDYTKQFSSHWRLEHIHDRGEDLMRFNNNKKAQCPTWIVNTVSSSLSDSSGRSFLAVEWGGREGASTLCGRLRNLDTEKEKDNSLFESESKRVCSIVNVSLKFKSALSLD